MQMLFASFQVLSIFSYKVPLSLMILRSCIDGTAAECPSSTEHWSKSSHRDRIR